MDTISTQKSSHMFAIYMARLVGRVLIFLCVFYLYLMHRDLLRSIVTQDFFHGFSPLHIVWGIMMAGMILHLLPRVRITMGEIKSRSETYRSPKEGYRREELLEYVQGMNLRAWKVLLIWLCFNAIFGLLFLARVIGVEELLMLTLFYYTSDTICMMLFCPFQKYIMGNRCCISCRIFDWGHMMMFTPMLFIPSFFSWSLLFMSLVVTIRWEIIYAAHPERFWRGSNEAIRCENCTDRFCKIKKPVVSGVDRVASSMPRPAKKIAARADELDEH